ncbi:MAG: hypothetical protein H0S79_23605 [Anaerolineaceae bacterium]|nr:hypothetical protein [Anaerolineaceae bacterium]
MSDSLLDLKPVSRVRRNHGLEHATMHVLGKKFPHVALAGYSDPAGFTIVGNVTTEDVAEAAIEALKKLRNGEAQLATHKNCGTNFVVSGAFAGLAAWLGTLGAGKEFKKKLSRLPLMMLLASIALVVAQPLGPIVQKQITTSGDPEGLELVRVETAFRAGQRLHRVITEG